MNLFNPPVDRWLHYTILLAALCSAGLSLYALVLCIRTPIKKRKWLWIIVTILGIGKLGIEWSSGELWHKILFLSILPVGWGSEADGPFVYASIPAGAILFLLLRNQLRRTDAPALPASTAGPTIAANQSEGDCGPQTIA